MISNRSVKKIWIFSPEFKSSLITFLITSDLNGSCHMKGSHCFNDFILAMSKWIKINVRVGVEEHDFEKQKEYIVWKKYNFPMRKKSFSFIRDVVSRIRSLYGEKGIELVYETPFQLLIAVILSAQTTDKQVNKITPPLFEKVREPKDIESLSLKEIEHFTQRVNYFRNKSKYLKQAGEKLVKEYHWIIPQDITLLQTLPWVGVKTAKVISSVLYNTEDVGVDTHIHRVLNRIGIIQTKNPLESDRIISSFPRDIRKHMHHPTVLFGRYICRARNPKCSECPLQTSCDFYKKTIAPSRTKSS